MADEVVEVDEATYDHLAALALIHGKTIDDMARHILDEWFALGRPDARFPWGRGMKKHPH